MQAMHRLIIFLILSLGCVLPVSGKVAPTTLEELIEIAEYIVVGRVSSVSDVQGVRVAALDPAMFLKGLRHPELFFLAEASWTCDISTAEPDEEILVFLSRYRFDPEPARRGDLEPGDVRLGFKEPEGFAAAIGALSGATPFLVVEWSGRGRMPIRQLDDRAWVTIWTGDVQLPRSIPTIDGPEPEHSSFIRSVKLDSILRFIEDELEPTASCEKAERVVLAKRRGT